MSERADCTGPLTEREAEIIELVAEGLLNKQIARRLEISQHTVKNHLHCAFLKLGVGTRTAAVAEWARRRGGEGGNGDPEPR